MYAYFEAKTTHHCQFNGGSKHMRGLENNTLVGISTDNCAIAIHFQYTQLSHIKEVCHLMIELTKRIIL